jgi:Holliday junction resolvase RusA-like endonuclease
MGGYFSKGGSTVLSTAEEHRLARKCKSLSQAYTRCHKANPGDARACSNLETSLVMCYAADLCKEASEAHQRCYMSIMNTGRAPDGRRDCDVTVKAMQDCLKKYRLYPFNI